MTKIIKLYEIKRLNNHLEDTVKMKRCDVKGGFGRSFNGNGRSKLP
jgi:hypothetical protein